MYWGKLLTLIIQAAALVACGRPQELSALYSHVVIDLPTPQEERVSQKLRDVLMKEWTLVGIPLVVTGLTALGAAESSEIRGGLSQKWYCSSYRGKTQAKTFATGSSSIWEMLLSSEVLHSFRRYTGKTYRQSSRHGVLTERTSNGLRRTSYMDCFFQITVCCLRSSLNWSP